MMTEAQTVANKLGITFRLTIDKRIADAEKIGAHKTSMLQDIEAGREPEIEALVGSVIEPPPRGESVDGRWQIISKVFHFELEAAA